MLVAANMSCKNLTTDISFLAFKEVTCLSALLAFMQGCIQGIDAWVKTNVGIIAGVALGIAFFEVSIPFKILHKRNCINGFVNTFHSLI